MIPTLARYAIRAALILVTAAAALFLLLLAAIVIARYEPDSGYCPDAPIAELEAKILAFAREQRMELNGAEFVGIPRYRADKHGWWAFDLKSHDENYVATIDCDGRITGFGTIRKLSFDPPPRSAQ
ncbi:hypothetical protein GQ57_20985 [Burkholderia sp. MSh2]|nr:hypothetical protein GQ57_20985 [Burkholderia sp. MSh2]KFG95747.1 hypothetical protein GQ56_0118745 [Burkholderia paludis]